MKKNYQNFNKIDFAADEYFLRWRFNSDKETNEFWNDFLIEHPEKQTEINKAIKIVDSARINDYKFSSEEINQGLKAIFNRKQKDRQKRKWLVYSVSTAAVLVLALITVFNIPEKTSKKQLAEITVESIEKQNDIQLIISNDNTLTFEDNADIEINNEGDISLNTSDKKQLISKKEVNNEVQLNKLIVPFGKRSSLLLSDGSKITINSGSVLEFPQVFSGNTREIKIEGEAFIEVVKNENKPFIVNTSQMSVNVLGTIFNISAYPDDDSQKVVLVEGSVKIETNNGNSETIKPNELSTLNNGILETRQVDVYDYISWVDGIFRFSGEPLENVLVRLSRYYNINIESTNDVKNNLVSGKLVLFDNIDTVLENIAVILPIEIEKSDKKILIRKGGHM